MKTVLVDLTRYQEKCGFGEIANNYAEHLRKGVADDIHFVVLVKEEFKGALGDSVDYVTIEHLNEDLKALGRKIDLWHATDQLFIKRKHVKGMVSLLTIHDLNFLYEKKGIHKLKWFLKLKWLVKRSDCITVISEFVKQDLLAHVKVGNKPLHVIYNGIKDSDDEQQAKPHFITDDTKFFFTIGQTRQKKNFQKLIPMMKFFPDYKLFICGKKHHSYYEQLHMIKEENHADNVYITGEITEQEKKWMYTHCEAFLFPSLFEGFGLPVLEAMRNRCKVFSSRCTSLPEICKDNATYFESFDAKDMADTVKKGLESWDKASSIATKAREYALGYSYKKYVESYIALYKQLLHMQ